MDTDVIEEVNGIIIDIRILEIYRRIVGVEANNCGNAMIFGNAPEIGMRETIQPIMFQREKENRRCYIRELHCSEPQFHKYDD